jgi:hypothetical protein
VTDPVQGKVFTNNQMPHTKRNIVSRAPEKGCKVSKLHRLSKASTKRTAALGLWLAI